MKQTNSATGISPINQWIGLRENLNLKAYSFYHYICGFPVIVPRKPIQCLLAYKPGYQCASQFPIGLGNQFSCVFFWNMVCKILFQSGMALKSNKPTLDETINLIQNCTKDFQHPVGVSKILETLKNICVNPSEIVHTRSIPLDDI